MSRFRIFARVVSAVAFLLFISSTVHAQYRASIQGVVTDPSGAVVSDANVSLTNLDTNQTLTTTSNDSGVFNFNALPPSRFTLTAEKRDSRSKHSRTFRSSRNSQTRSIFLWKLVMWRRPSLSTATNFRQSIRRPLPSPEASRERSDPTSAFVRTRCLPIGPVGARSFWRWCSGKWWRRPKSSRHTRPRCEPAATRAFFKRKMVRRLWPWRAVRKQQHHD